MNNYGHFNAEGTEFIITNPKTPRDFDNYLFNNAIYSEVQQTGVGYTMYQIDGTETTLLSSMHRDVYYERDSIMNRLVYVRDNETGEFWNLNWEPVKKETEYFRCRHGLGYTILESKVNDIEASLRIFVCWGGGVGTPRFVFKSNSVSGDPPRGQAGAVLLLAGAVAES